MRQERKSPADKGRGHDLLGGADLNPSYKPKRQTHTAAKRSLTGTLSLRYAGSPGGEA